MQISEKLRDIVGKDNVLIGEPVTKIDQSDRDIIRVTTATGKDFKCRYIINAAPLHCSGECCLPFHSVVVVVVVVAIAVVAIVVVNMNDFD